MSWNQKQEEIILNALVAKPATTKVLVDSLLKGRNKRHFVGKTQNAVKAKARSLVYEALLNDVLLVMPPEPPKPKRKTAAELRKEMFSKMTKMTAQQKTSKSVSEAIKEAKEVIAKREAAAKKAKATRAKNRSAKA